MISFALEKRPDATGQMIDTLIKYTKEEGKPDSEEAWTTVQDLDRLFDTCSRRWDVHGWDLEKLLTCIRECEFD